MDQIINEVIKARYAEYLESTDANSVQEKNLSALSADMDDLIERKRVTYESVADYEEAARCAGFYAGFKSALELLGRE